MRKYLKWLLLPLLLVSVAYAAEIEDLSTTDASNTARFPENMAPSAVNDGARALEGILARWHKDWNGSLQDSGSSNAYVVAANRTISAYTDGLTVAFTATFANTGTASVNIDSVGAKEIVKNFNTGLAANDIKAGQKVIVVYDDDNDTFQMVSPLGNATTSVITTRGDVIRGDSGGSAERLALGASSAALISDGTDAVWGFPGADNSTVGGLETATQAEMEAGSDASKIVTPSVQHNHPSSAKGWVVFQVNGTVDASYNVTSITDTGTGNWTVNWATNFSGASYAVVASFEKSALSANWVETGTFAAGTTQIEGFNNTPANDETNVTNIHVIAFGDQ